MAEAVQALLEEVSTNDVPEAERRALDGALFPHAFDFKGALLKALRLCSCARGFLGLPALMEETRKLLCTAPAKGVAIYLEEKGLCADIDKCTAPRSLAAVRDLMAFMTGQSLDTGKPRLKKELGGFELPTPHKKSCRTALNRASKALEALETAARKEQQTLLLQQHASRQYETESDVRLDEEARRAGEAAGVETAFERASLKLEPLRLQRPGGKASEQQPQAVKPPLSAFGMPPPPPPPPQAQPPPQALVTYEMPEGSLREDRLEEEHRVAAQAAGIDALVDQAVNSSRKPKAQAAGLNYSKFDNIVDSDDEDDVKPPRQQAAPVNISWKPKATHGTAPATLVAHDGRPVGPDTAQGVPVAFHATAAPTPPAGQGEPQPDEPSISSGEQVGTATEQMAAANALEQLQSKPRDRAILEVRRMAVVAVHILPASSVRGAGRVLDLLRAGAGPIIVAPPSEDAPRLDDKIGVPGGTLVDPSGGKRATLRALADSVLQEHEDAKEKQRQELGISRENWEQMAILFARTPPGEENFDPDLARVLGELEAGSLGVVM